MTNSRIGSLNDDTALATELEENYVGNYDMLPRRTGTDGHNYYDPVLYTYYRKRDIAGAGLTVIGGIATGAVALQGGLHAWGGRQG